MTTIHYEPARYKFLSKFYAIGVRIFLIIRQQRIQTRVIAIVWHFLIVGIMF